MNTQVEQPKLENGFLLNNLPAQKGVRLFKFAGSSVSQQLAVRVDSKGIPTGQWFKRYQYKDSYGYKWSPWESTDTRPYWHHNEGEDSASWGLCGHGWIEVSGGMNYNGKVRLPRT